MGAEQNFDWASHAASTLEWWQEAGVDVVIDEAPRNWLTEKPQAVASPIAPTAKERRAVEPVAPAAIVFPAELASFMAWRMSDAAPDAGWIGRAIGAQGSTAATLVIVVDAPERDDSATGNLISGSAGLLFDKMLAAIGFDRGSVLLVPMCVKRPSTGRMPPEAEPVLAAMLRRQLQLVAPKRVLILGNAASRAVIGADVGPSRGSLRSINHDGIELHVATSFHPRFLLERPAAKPEAWKDLQLLIQGIDA